MYDKIRFAMKRLESHTGFHGLPALNVDRVTAMVRNLASQPHASVYFESDDDFLKSAYGQSDNWNLWAIVSGRETTLYQEKNGSFKTGKGSALLLRSDNGNLAVLPNDGNKQQSAELLLSIKDAGDLFAKDMATLRNIRNAIRTNLTHRREKLFSKKPINKHANVRR
jgi:hypothetical protein